jgi:Na+-translocating ferredoxin:NAD+ oxidoreductase RnfC subunit
VDCGDLVFMPLLPKELASLFYNEDEDNDEDDDETREEEEELFRCFQDSFETEGELIDLQKLQRHRKRRMANEENGGLPEIDCQIITTPANRHKLQKFQLMKATKKAAGSDSERRERRHFGKRRSILRKAAISSDQGTSLGLEESVLEAVVEWKEKMSEYTEGDTVRWMVGDE